MWLIKTIYPSIVKVMFIDKYNHDDYILGMDAPEKVFAPVLEIMEAFRKGSNSSKYMTNHDKQKNLDLKDFWVF